ncbi:stage III sporulation protein AE [Lachnoclostridium sp. An181]|uniref:stage III sporulation protein AE n=1 Tax=Lachnoclostridium sp. An181 TaxID=1965575 RepID=UPI000B364F7C|nr:stage III sporulation protein AE [Lachnoclostridium sp. An181]
MKKKLAWLLLLILFWSAIMFQAYAGEEEKIEESAQELMGQMDTDEINRMMEEIFPGRKVSFEVLIKEIFSGDIGKGLETAGGFLKEQFFYQFQSQKAGMIHIFLIAFIAAVFSNFSSIFKNRQVSDISFYVLYLLMIMICLNAFGTLTDMAGERISILLDFMKVLGPVYMIAVGMAKGVGSALSFYSLILILIFLIELLILNFLLPLIHVWVMVQILNFLSPEEYLSKFGELIEMLISWILKSLLAGVIGLNIIQGLLHPAVDSVKRNALTKTIQIIPGVGDVLGGAGSVLVGTAVLIKNGIGVGGAVVCMGIFLFPLLEIACYAFAYRLIAALVQPVSDGRIVGCISGMAKGCQMMMRIVFTTGILFLLSIAIIAATTS